jgi:hypothetical protein
VESPVPIKSVFVLGSGRSGTSLAAGLLAGAGYHIGARPIRSTEANPKGFFESGEIEGVNERILRTVVPARPRWFRRLFRGRPRKGQFWLAHRPDAVQVVVFREPDRTADSILREAATAPYLRDFRFDREDALGLWELMYRRVLDRRPGDRSFPDPELARSRTAGPAEGRPAELYPRLCTLAGHDDG